MHLSRELIVDAAVALLDEYGLADTTMRRVASSLNSAPGALYWHVANKQALIAAIAERIVDAPSLSTNAATPEAFAHNLRARLLSHRDGAEVVSAGLSQPGDKTWLDLVEQLSGILPASIPEEDRRLGATALLHLVVGAATMEQARQQLLEAAGGTAPEAGRGASEAASAGAAELTRGVSVIVNGLVAESGR